jgi:hypothetical protein
VSRARWGRGFASAAVALFVAAAGSAGAARTPARYLTVHPGRAVRLPVIARTRGPTTPHDFDLSLLIPPHTRLRQVWFLHGGRRADQVLVEWVQRGVVSLYAYRFPDTVRWGLTLWTQRPRTGPDYYAPWQGVALPLVRHLAPGAPNLDLAFADVTSDGHPDVLLAQYPHTNHDCGPHRVFATLAQGRTWRIFSSWLCETPLRGSRGLLALDLPYYQPGDSVCCWSKVERVRLRWNERRYVKASDRIVRSRVR